MDCNIFNVTAILIFGAIMLLIGLSVSFIRERRRHRLIHIYLEALRNKDYSFRLPSGKNKINRALNQITELLQNDKLSATEQEKYYELIINSMSIGVIVVDERDNIIKFNEETLNLFNRSVLTHLSQLAPWDNLNEVLTEMSPKEKRHILIKTPKKELNTSVHLDVITLRGKTLRIYTFNDIHSEIDRTEFDSWIKLTRVLTHEIMNGIAPINSLSDTLKNEQNLPELVKDGLEAISTSSHSLINFVESYRRFSRIPTPKPSLFQVKDLVLQVQQLHSNVKIGVSITPDDLMLYADESLILQVITNIVKNAIEALGERTDGEIRIKAYLGDFEQVKIEISNNGPAIPQEEIDEIFIPFFTTKKSGSGIGLSVSRQIMLLSQGNITLTSTPSHKFTTTFTLTFL